MAMPDDDILRKLLTRLNAAPRAILDFTHVHASSKHQWTESAVTGWFEAMHAAGWVTQARRHWVITSAGQRRLRDLEGMTYEGVICAASSRQPLTGYGAMMARTEIRPGCNDYRKHSSGGI